MSTSGALPFLPDTTSKTGHPLHFQQSFNSTGTPGSFVFPSPPPSDGSDGGLGFDDTFEEEQYLDFGFEATTPSSTTASTTASLSVVSPQSTASLGTPPAVSNHFPVVQTNSGQGVGTENELPLSEALALSNHHLQRYFHYKALAAQAETAASSTGSDEFDAYLNEISMSAEPKTQLIDFKHLTAPAQVNNSNNMLAFTAPPQPQPANGMMYSGMPNNVSSSWDNSAQFDAYSTPVAVAPPNNSAAAMHHAQAQAHMQASDAALARAHQRNFSASSFASSARSSFDNTASIWPRASLSTQSTASEAYPSTPNVSAPLPMTPMAPAMVKSSTMSSMQSTHSLASLPISAPVVSVPMASLAPVAPLADVVPQVAPVPVRPPVLPEQQEGENELDDSDQEGDVSMDDSTETDVKPSIPTAGMTNLHGGGRGYVPGKTPDDPKKRHKCQICGRGFARAFNLKVRHNESVLNLT